MILGVLVLAVPVLIALLIWWWRFRSTGRYGKSLPIFLLGYAILMIINGASRLVDDWGRSSEGFGEYALLICAITFGGYVLGGLTWLLLVTMRETLLGVASEWLNVETAADSERKAAGEDARQRAIEECAEEAYEYLIENESLRAAGHDRTERLAARLREAILALGQRG
jgi:MFS superfamily sulfate permease-like transporter